MNQYRLSWWLNKNSYHRTKKIIFKTLYKMTTNIGDKPRKKYQIELLLKKVRWAKSELARNLKVTPRAVELFYNRGVLTVWKQKEHTRAFNECFEENYSYKELFSLED